MSGLVMWSPLILCAVAIGLIVLGDYLHERDQRKDKR